MGREQQTEEREVLDSIYPDEITDISETSYRISIALDLDPQDGDESEPPIILLTVSLPPSYPDDAPLLDLSTPPNAPKHSLLDIQSDRSSLLSALEETITENLGTAMIFTLVSALKEHAESLITSRQASVQQEKDREAVEKEEEENRKFHGQAVTRESFLEWRESFRGEMEKAEEEKRKREEAEEGKKKIGKGEDRMTGRELWEKGLVGKGEEEEDEREVEGIEELAVKE